VTSKKAKSLDFEQALSELETVVERLEHGELPLEEALKQFERGIELARSCQVSLKQASRRSRSCCRSRRTPSRKPSNRTSDLLATKHPDPTMNPTLSVRLDDWRHRVERELDRWLPPESAIPSACTRRNATACSEPASGSDRARVRDCRDAGPAARRSGRRRLRRRADTRYSLVHDDLPAMDDDDLRRGRPRATRHSTRRPRSSPETRCRCWRSSCSRP